MKKLRLAFLALCAAASAAALVSGCATPTYDRFSESRALIDSGHEEEGLAQLEALQTANPQDVELRTYYLRHRAVAVQRDLQAGDNALASGELAQSEAAYRQALRFEPGNLHAKAGLERIDKARRTQGLVAQAQAALRAGDRAAALSKAHQALDIDPGQRDARALVRKIEEENFRAESAPPQLQAALKNRITIELKDAPLRSVFELLSKKSGLNFVYDKDLPPDARTTVFVRDTTIEDVIQYLLVTNQLARRVLNANTMLIYPNTPQKAQAYKELVVKSFYLGNADAKQTANMIRSLVKTRDLFVDEKLNLLIIRDTPEAVRVAEKLVADQDLAEPEVMLDVSVLEVGRTQLEQLGIQWPTQISAGLTGAAGVAGQITGSEAKHFTGDLVRLNVSDPLIALNLQKEAGRTNLLANPRIRVMSREKAHILIGDRVPVITTTAGATGFVSESVNYLDVGLKLDVQPVVRLDGDVSIKVGLEVSNITNQVKSSTGTVAFQIGTRNADTTLQLHDGETEVLAGLISDEDRRTASQVPALSRLPVLGRLFSNDGANVTKTEVVLLITPHVVRNIQRPGIRKEEFNSGTELDVGAGMSGATLPPTVVPPVAPQPPAPPAPAQPAAPDAAKPQ